MLAKNKRTARKCSQRPFDTPTEVTLPSCLSVLSEHVASQSKWQSADLDLLKLAKERRSVWPALFRGNVCIQSDKISNVSAIVNQNTRSPTLSENLNLEKEWPFLMIPYWPVNHLYHDKHKQTKHCRGNPHFLMNKSTAVASNRPTEALASVISFTFVVYSHYKHS